MAVESKASVAAHFIAYNFPSAADFGSLIDSYTDASEALEAIATAARTGSKGLVYVSGASAVSFYSAGAVGLRIANTATTAAALGAIGGTTVGQAVFTAATTAAAQQAQGGGTVGRSVFETTTTAALQSIVGNTSAASQSEVEAVTLDTKVLTPFNAKWLPQLPKAWATISGGANPVDIKASYGIATVSSMATGLFNVVFSTVQSSDSYCITGGMQHNGATRWFHVNSAATVSAGGFQAYLTDGTGSLATPNRFYFSVFGDI